MSSKGIGVVEVDLLLQKVKGFSHSGGIACERFEEELMALFKIIEVRAIIMIWVLIQNLPPEPG